MDGIGIHVQAGDGLAEGGHQAVAQADDALVIDSPGLRHPLKVDSDASVVDGVPVFVALRPEKVMIGKDEPEGHTNKAQGVIEDIAYFGSHSVYHVRLPSGYKFMANFANVQRWASEGLTWNDEVWVWWGDNDGVVLTS